MSNDNMSKFSYLNLDRNKLCHAHFEGNKNYTSLDAMLERELKYFVE